LVFLFGFIFALPIIGFLFRFQIPISLFFFIAGTFLISILLVTDGIILNDRIQTETIEIVPVTTNHMNQNTQTVGQTLRNGLTRFVGEYIVNDNSALNMKEVNSITVRMDRAGGNVAGTILFGCWDGNPIPTSTNYRFLFGQLLANQTSGSDATYTITRNDTITYFMKVNDVCGVFFNDGDAGNNIIVYSNSTASSFDGSNSYRRHFNPPVTWVDASNADMRMKLSLVKTAELDSIEYEDNTMDFSFSGSNYQLKVIMIFVAVMFMVGGALTEVRKR
jgi:hypothetical protein